MIYTLIFQIVRQHNLEYHLELSTNYDLFVHLGRRPSQYARSEKQERYGPFRTMVLASAALVDLTSAATVDMCAACSRVYLVTGNTAVARCWSHCER